MKLNLGCGQNRLEGYVNVDMEPNLKPDVLANLCVFWPWDDGSVAEAVFNHSLEHMAAWQVVFKELWRVCRDGALVTITVPHVRHDDWLNDPTHVLRVTPEFMSLLSRKNCARFRELHGANSPLADYIGVDFDLVSAEHVLTRALRICRMIRPCRS